MKYLLILSCLVILSACTAKDEPQPQPAPAPPLTATERMIVGRWTLQKEADSVFFNNVPDSNATEQFLYPIDFYADFKTTLSQSAPTGMPTVKDLADAAGLALKGPGPTNQPQLSDGLWFVNNANRLYARGIYYEIITIDANTFVIQYRDGVGTLLTTHTLYFKK